MKNVIVTGGTGMIGGLVIKYCLEQADINRVTSIVRRTSGVQHPKLVEVIHDNFLDYTTIEEHFQNQDICLYCIGVYTGAVPKATFTKITVDFTDVFAKTIHKHNQEVTFCFLSGQGADSKEKSSVLFAKNKGIAENRLLDLGFDKTYIFRPGYIYPVTPRKEPNFTYRLMRPLYKTISKIYPNIGLSSETLAKAMVKAGLEGANKTILENKDIKAV